MPFHRPANRQYLLDIIDDSQDLQDLKAIVDAGVYFVKATNTTSRLTDL